MKLFKVKMVEKVEDAKQKKIEEAQKPKPVPKKPPATGKETAVLKPKSFDWLHVSTCEIISLMMVPFSCCFSHYQDALNVYLKKSKAKIIRELEISTLLKRIRDSKNLTQSIEQQELFQGLKKKYKYHYDNIINVSMDSEESLMAENS